MRAVVVSQQYLSTPECNLHTTSLSTHVSTAHTSSWQQKYCSDGAPELRSVHFLRERGEGKVVPTQTLCLQSRQRWLMSEKAHYSGIYTTRPARPMGGGARIAREVKTL